MQHATVERAIIDLPVRLLFTDEGVSYFMRQNKRLERFRLSDRKDEYGLQLSNFQPTTLQKMMLLGYVNKIELPLPEIAKHRSGIIDLTKLIAYGMLYQQFDTAVFERLVASDLVKDWNRKNARNPIDFKTRVNHGYLQSILEQNSEGLADVRGEIVRPVIAEIGSKPGMPDRDKQVAAFVAHRFLEFVSPLTWFVLSAYQGSSPYRSLVADIKRTLRSYVEKTSIAEYLALMLLEVVTSVKHDHDLTEDAEESDDGELFLLWKIRKRPNLEADRGKLHIIVANNRSRYETTKQNINHRSNIAVGQRSLVDFYSETEDANGTPSLGLYYLSFVHDACRKVGIHFESFVHQDSGSGHTLVNVVLLF